MSQSPRPRRRKRKPPRMVLLDTRSVADLDQLTGAARDLVGRLEVNMGTLEVLCESARLLISIISELHRGQQKRQEAAKKAAKTRADRAADNPPATPTDPDAPQGADQ